MLKRDVVGCGTRRDFNALVGMCKGGVLGLCNGARFNTLCFCVALGMALYCAIKSFISLMCF